MLRISKDQLERWHQKQPERFVDAILERVRERHPTWRQTDGMLRDSIRVGIRRARRNGFSFDRHISEFVLIMFEVAPNFDEQPDIRQALDDTTLSIEDRWERLFTPAYDRAWADADRPEFLDADAWFDQPAPDLSRDLLLTSQDCAEIVARALIARDTLSGVVPREPTDEELRSAAEALDLDYVKRNGAGGGP